MEKNQVTKYEEQNHILSVNYYSMKYSSEVFFFPLEKFNRYS